MSLPLSQNWVAILCQLYIASSISELAIASLVCICIRIECGITSCLFRGLIPNMHLSRHLESVPEKYPEREFVDSEQ